jgi:pimeloyl-ACP methyl ester carboxylesterase
MLKRLLPPAEMTRRQLVFGLAAGATLVTSIASKSGHALDAPMPPTPARPAPPKPFAPHVMPWLTLPGTPVLPVVSNQGLIKLSDGASVFFAQFGKGPHVLLLHGGSANSNYWGHQITALSNDFSVTVMDTRGHGRSPVITGSFSYSQFANDVVGLLKHLDIPRAMVVGWSDGGITGIQLALTRPDLMSGLFAFGANATLDGLKAGGARTGVFQMFSSRCRTEYLSLSPHPERWPELQRGLGVMWRTQPTFSKQQLATIQVPVMVADGEYDEIIKPAHTRQIAASIQDARLSVMSEVSHFAMLQDPSQFNAVLSEFLFNTI